MSVILHSTHSVLSIHSAQLCERNIAAKCQSCRARHWRCCWSAVITKRRNLWFWCLWLLLLWETLLKCKAPTSQPSNNPSLLTCIHRDLLLLPLSSFSIWLGMKSWLISPTHSVSQRGGERLTSQFRVVRCSTAPRAHNPCSKVVKKVDEIDGINLKKIPTDVGHSSTSQIQQFRQPWKHLQL